ncbi:MAG TPA: CocE/NonD family hydrolase C-terminal non-catalytic domain-containing protein, partial [Nevskia sp.]|nr:CocE/NonD family hydrolase C-terminal non-catalytic domain-containing protein [Nevskia sp.]
QGYPDLPSLGTATDPATTGDVAAVLNGTPLKLFDILPLLRHMNTVEPQSLSYTTPPFTAPVRVVGQGSLDLFVATLTPSDDLNAVIADVWPDGTAYPIAAGRLRTSFPNVVAARSVTDANGQMVQPYGDYSANDPALPGAVREYHLEFWPIGNVFPAGHRLRLYLVGTSDFMLPQVGVNLVSIGGATPSRLLLPVLPGSDALAAMNAAD